MAASPSHGSSAHSTAHTTILFVLVAVITGCAVQHFISRYAKWLPFSPAMFVCGILLSVLDELALSRAGDSQLHESI